MKKILVPALIVIAGVVIFFIWSGNRSENPTSYPHSGTVEAVEVAVSFQIPGKVNTVEFQEGETIREGQILATLDTVSLAQELARANAALATSVSRLATAGAKTSYLRKSVQAQIAGAKATLQKLVSGLRPQEVENARQNVEKAQAEADRAQKEASRVRKLYEEGVVPLVRRENADTAAQVADASLASAKENLDLAESGARKEDIQTARAAFRAARARLEEVQSAVLESQSLKNEVDLRKAEVELASIRFGKATLRSPLSGMALTRAVEPGENVPAARPVTTISDLTRIKVRFYVPEEELGDLKLGDPVRIFSDSSPNSPFRGHISFISDRAEFTPKDIMTKEERTKLVFMVKAQAANPDQKLKPGMPVDVSLER